MRSRKRVIAKGNGEGRRPREAAPEVDLGGDAESETAIRTRTRAGVREEMPGDRGLRDEERGSPRPERGGRTPVTGAKGSPPEMAPSHDGRGEARKGASREADRERERRRGGRGERVRGGVRREGVGLGGACRERENSGTENAPRASSRGNGSAVNARTEGRSVRSGASPSRRESQAGVRGSLGRDGSSSPGGRRRVARALDARNRDRARSLGDAGSSGKVRAPGRGLVKGRGGIVGRGAKENGGPPPSDAKRQGRGREEAHAGRSRAANGPGRRGESRGQRKKAARRRRWTGCCRGRGWGQGPLRRSGSGRGGCG